MLMLPACRAHTLSLPGLLRQQLFHLTSVQLVVAPIPVKVWPVLQSVMPTLPRLSSLALGCCCCRLRKKRFKKGGRQTVCKTTDPLLPHFYDENLSCSILLVFASIHTLTLTGSLSRTGLDTVIHHHPLFVDSSDDSTLILPTAAITLLILCTLFQPADVTLLWILWGLTVWLLSPTPELSPL